MANKRKKRQLHPDWLKGAPSIPPDAFRIPVTSQIKEQSMSSLNACAFTGRLGRDPEVSVSQNGLAICKFSIAVDRYRKGQDGEGTQDTMWLNVILFGQLAERADKLFTKGDLAAVSGEFWAREYIDKSGSPRQSLELTCRSFELLHRRQNPKPAEGGRDPFLPDFPDE